MKVTVLPARETYEVEARDVKSLLKSLNLASEAYMVIRGDDILTRDVRLRPDDAVELWPVISGGGGG